MEDGDELVLDNGAEDGQEEEGDMYGDSLDTGWLNTSSMKGIRLLREAESAICLSMLKRDNAERPCVWRDVGWEEEGVTTSDIKGLKEHWVERGLQELSGKVLTALCLRFGQPYSELQAEIAAALASTTISSERGIIERRVISDFGLKKIKDLLTLQCEVNVTALIEFLREAEQRLELVELQISRAGAMLDPFRIEAVNNDNLGELLKRLGCPGVSGPQAMSLVASAMLDARLDVGAACPFGRLEKYCITRAQRKAEKGESMRSLLFAMMRPKEHMAMLQRQQQQKRSEGEDVNANAPAEMRHVLVAMAALPKNANGAVFPDALMTAVRKWSPGIPDAFLVTLCSLWYRHDVDQFVPTAVVEAFFFPSGGFSLRVRNPLGGFVIRGKFKATSPVDLLYTIIIKQLFVKLRQTRHSDNNLRVPSDLILFADADCTVVIPRSKNVSIASQVDDGGKIFAHSAYIAGLADQDKDDAEAAKENAKGGKGNSGGKGRPSTSEGAAGSGDGRGGGGGGGGGRPSSAPDSSYVPKARKEPKTIQEALDRLTKVAAPVEMPPHPPFPGVESEAHTWGIPLTLKYLKDELELPDYDVEFIRGEMTGLKFICLDEERARSTLSCSHVLHSHKIAAYALKLREKVLEKAAIQRPAKLDEWGSVHVAGWLQYKADCPKSALAALRGALDGVALIAKKDKEDELLDALGGDDSEETSRAVKMLLELVEKQLLQQQQMQQASSSSSSSSSSSPRMAARVEALLDQEGEQETQTSSPLDGGSTRMKAKRQQQKEKEEKPEGGGGNVEDKKGEEATASAKKKRGKAKSASVTEEGEATGAAAPVALADDEEQPSDEAAIFKKKGSIKKKEVTIDASSQQIAAAVDAERETFAKKIASLQQMVEGQHAAMSKLEEQSRRLKDEKTAAERKLRMEQEQAQTAIRALQQDRSLATKALEQITERYVADVGKGIQAVQGEMKLVALDTMQLGSEIGQVKSSVAAAASAAAVDADEAEYEQLHAFIFDDDDNAEYDQVLEFAFGSKPATRAPPAPAAMTGPVTAAAVAPRVVAPKASDEAKALALAQPVPMHKAATTAPAPAAASAPAFSIGNLGQSVGVDTERPLVEAERFLGVSSKKEEGDTDEDDTPIELSLKSLLDTSAASEAKLWRHMLKRYCHRKETTFAVSDTTSQLGRMACLWVRLGIKMLDDSRASPASYHAYVKNLENASDQQRAEAKEQAHLAPPSPAIIDALKGLERCSRQLLVPPTLIHTEEDDDTARAVGETSAIGLMPRRLIEEPEKRKLRVRSRSPTQHASSSAGALHSKPKEVSPKRWDYEVSVGMVFGLGLVRKMMERYPSPSDQTNLLFLFTRLREGTLPFSELSRENLRSLLTSTLNLALPSWPQFDALCQRFDPECKGLVTAPVLLSALRNLNLPSDGLGPGDAQGLSLLCVSLAASALSRRGKESREALIDVISAGAPTIASFSSLIKGKDENKRPTSPSRNASSKSIAASEATTTATTSDTNTNTDSAAASGNGGKIDADSIDIKIADETVLVSDLLHELCKAFFLKLQQQQRAQAEARGELPRVGSDPLTWRRVRPSSTCPLSFCPPTPGNLFPACSLVARVLQIYEARDAMLLTALGTLFATVLNFRRVCLKRMRAEEEVAEREVTLGQVTLRKAPSMYLTTQQIDMAYAGVEADLKTLIGKESARMMMMRADLVSIEEFERLVCELVGAPVPHGGVLGLLQSQKEVEIYLFHQQSKKQQEESAAALQHQQRAYTNALSDIQKSLFGVMPSASSAAAVGASGRGKLGASSSGGKQRQAAAAVGGVMDEMDALMQKQRVDQAAAYLEHMNGKAIKRRKVLEALLHLWESAKLLSHAPRPHAFGGASSSLPVESPLSVEDIIRRTRDLQRHLFEDMQATPSTHVQQLATRVETLRVALSKRTIEDDDLSLSVTLREIYTLEGGLVRANDDALSLAQKILNLTAKYA